MPPPSVLPGARLTGSIARRVLPPSRSPTPCPRPCPWHAASGPGLRPGGYWAANHIAAGQQSPPRGRRARRRLAASSGSWRSDSDAPAESSERPSRGGGRAVRSRTGVFSGSNRSESPVRTRTKLGSSFWRASESRGTERDLPGTEIFSRSESLRAT